MRSSDWWVDGGGQVPLARQLREAAKRTVLPDLRMLLGEAARVLVDLQLELDAVTAEADRNAKNAGIALKERDRAEAALARLKVCSLCDGKWLFGERS